MNKPTYKDFYKQLETICSDNGGKVGLHSNKEQTEFHMKLFHVLTSLVGVGGCTVHDAGCGYGDILRTIWFEKGKYIGTDSREHVIEEAKKTYEGHKFLNLDLTNTIAPESDITIAIGTTAFVTKTDAVKIFENLEFATKKALLFTCWGSFEPVTGSLKKEGKLMYNWLKKRMESGESSFNRSALVTADKHGEAVFIFFNE